MDAIAVASDIVAIAAQLAGLILVYLVLLATSYSGFQPTERKSIKPRYLLKAWIAFAGMTFALLSALTAIASKWLSNPCLAYSSLTLLLCAFFWGIAVAILTIREIK